MKRKAVGFYWTLPVPWAGFRTVPKDVDAAAKASRTIAFQRALTRRYAQNNGMALVHEAAVVELRPDGGGKEIAGPLAKVAQTCRNHQAIVLYTDFAEFHLWRSNQPMMDAVRDLGIDAHPIAVEALILDGAEFDPYRHFAEWRSRQAEWSDSKPARIAAARQRAGELAAGGVKNPEIARHLNDEGLRSATGKPWTADSLRKALATQG